MDLMGAKSGKIPQRLAARDRVRHIEPVETWPSG